MESNAVIRAVRAGEWRMVRDIRLRSLEDSPDAFGSALTDERSLPDRAWIERTERYARGDDSAAFIAETPAGWIGFVMARIEAEDRTRAGLFGLWVDPAARAAGAGLALTQAVIAWALEQGARTLALSVVASNSTAIRIYRRAGLAETGNTMPMPRKPQLMEIQMEKNLMSPAADGGV
ncbi:MAG: GNAT family N-acetyltransferase [Candidatus Limnocylindrales bacterium]|jgi:ribosomal protein S18 acetylase RimI-like enzyme